MTAPPGNNLEFFEAEPFKSHASKRQDLASHIIEAIRNKPRQGHEFTPGVFQSEISLKAELWAFIYRRQGQHVGLMDVFLMPEQETSLTGRVADLIDLFSKKSRGGRK